MTDMLTLTMVVTVTLPGDAWIANYGTLRKAVPDDVAEYVENSLHQSLVTSLGVHEGDVAVSASVKR